MSIHKELLLWGVTHLIILILFYGGVMQTLLGYEESILPFIFSGSGLTLSFFVAAFGGTYAVLKSQQREKSSFKSLAGISLVIVLGWLAYAGLLLFEGGLEYVGWGLLLGLITVGPFLCIIFAYFLFMSFFFRRDDSGRKKWAVSLIVILGIINIVQYFGVLRFGFLE